MKHLPVSGMPLKTSAVSKRKAVLMMSGMTEEPRFNPLARCMPADEETMEHHNL